MRWMLVFLIALSGTEARATSFATITVPDPIKADAVCSVEAMLSFGSYIYDYPSKYDQIFAPLTDPNLLWFCPSSGFVSLADDFEGITPEEKRAIAAFLDANYDSSVPLPVQGKLALLEKIYSFRKKDPDFRAKLLRVLAYQYESADLATAMRYRREALHQISSGYVEYLMKLKESIARITPGRRLAPEEEHP